MIITKSNLNAIYRWILEKDELNMTNNELGGKVALGATGMMVGRLGIGSGYGGPAKMYREAFEAGCNYFWWDETTRYAMGKALGELFASGHREDVVLAMLVYVPGEENSTKSVERCLLRLKTDYADILMLSTLVDEPSPRLLEKMDRLKERGLCRAVGISSHNRRLVASLAERGVFDVFHIRYNFVHPGAEQDIFPQLAKHNPGIVVFRSTDQGDYRYLRRPNGNQVGIMDLYRWVISDPHVHVVLSSPGSLKNLRHNLKLLSLPPMSMEDREEMRVLGKAVHERER